MTYTIPDLISRYEELKLPKMAKKTILEALGELSELELSNKTDLTVSIEIETIKQRYSVYFKSFHELMPHLKQACHENRLEAKIKWYCNYMNRIC